VTRGRVEAAGDEDAPDDFDDLPETHLGDEDYASWLERESGPEGDLSRSPSVGFWIALFLLVVLAIAVVTLARG
jgi:hypothetical protein